MKSPLIRILKVAGGYYYETLINKPFATFLIIACYIFVISFAIYTDKTKGHNSLHKSTAGLKIIQSIDSNNSSDLSVISDKIKIIFNSYDRQANGKLSEYGLVSLLEDAFAMHSDKLDSTKSNILMNIILKQKEKDPYYGIKFEQKVIIQRLEYEFKPLEHNTNVHFIEQIKEVIRRQNSEIEELKKSNILSIPLGVISIIMTVIFGIIGLFYPFIRKKRATKTRQTPSSDNPHL